MNTISNERLEKLSEYDCADRHEVMSMATELLALRKERAEPVAYIFKHPVGKLFWALTDESNKDHADVMPVYAAPPAPVVPDAIPETESKDGNDIDYMEPSAIYELGKTHGWNACRAAMLAAPAPVVVDDSLPFDPQIAEYEQMMEAEQAQADATPQQFESLAGKAVVPAGWKLVPIELTKEMRGKIHPFAEATCLNCGRQVVADCEDNVTASWNDMLAVAPAPVGKQSSTAEGNNDGFECTPVADLYELLTKCGECYDYTTSAKVASDWIKEGYSAREYVKLDRLQEAMTHGSSGEPDGWIPCSERMPVEKDIVLVVDDGYFVCEAQYREGDFFSAVRGNNEFFETTCRDVEFWQPLPEPPCK